MKRFSNALKAVFAAAMIAAEISATSTQANEARDLWGAVIFFCGEPIPAQPWGQEACAIAQSAAQKQAEALNLPLAAVDASRAGLAGGPDRDAPQFDWGKALRMLAKFEKTESLRYPWSMTILFYDHPADAAGERLESNFRTVYTQSASFVEGDELKNTREVAPLLIGGLMEQLFKDR